MGILKSKYRAVRLVSGLVAGFLLAGCVGAPVTFPEVDNKTVAQTGGRTIQAGTCGFQLLLLIPIGINDRAERAYAELREQAGSDVITEVYVREKWFYGFVGTGYCTQMSAKAYRRETALPDGARVD